MVTRLRVVLTCLSVALLGACSGGAQSPKCVPGLTRDCPCPTGQPGAQTCTSAGTFAACVCVVPTADAGGAGASTDAADAAEEIAVTDSVPPADAGDEVGAMDSGLPVDAGAADVAYVAISCGDGIVALPEQCDDGNTVAGDGCSPTCKVEIGHKCAGSPSVCTPTICGDGIVEGTETCDDGNTMPFDGCSEDCQLEPDCSAGSCTSKCGDGIVIPPEQCDDGNNVDGDGCSKDCTIEPGWTCTQPSLGDKMMVPVIYRDFKFHNPSDFEAGVIGQSVATTGIVETDLDQDGKPVFSGLATAHIASTSTFGEWYRNTPGVNHPTASKMALWNNGQGGYVNRYGANGEQWNVTEPANWCGLVGQELLDANGKPIPCTYAYSSPSNPTGGQTDCQKLEAQGYTQLPGSCIANSEGTYTAEYIVAKVDGNPLFFPIDTDPFSADQLEAAQVPSVPLGLYDASGTWPWDLDASGNKVLHNFSFTSEARYWFLYDKTKSYTLNFVGDDDVWVFINKRLAVDLGGVHTPVEGSVTLNAATASTLGLADGKVYEIAVFQAERQTTDSSFELTLSGFNAAPSECTPCGDGIMAGGGGCASTVGGAGGAPGTGTGGATGSMTGVPSGGASTTGGKGGVGGNGGAGGSSYIGASGITTSPFAGNGGAGGTTDTSAGGIRATGGVGGSSGTTPLPTDALAVYVAEKITGETGEINLSLRIDNLTSQSVDMSSVTLRYWYQDEGLGTALMLTSLYVGIGYSNQGRVTGEAVAASPPVPGADHYIELSFSGTLAAKGDGAMNDQFTIQVGMHTANYQGAVDVTNDYSYNGGATGYDDKITLYQNGKLISGVEPGGSG